MSLQLILGSSGSGKSYQLYEHIIQASMQSPGTQFLVIVPEQFTMQTQRELVRLHPLKGLLNIDILSFQRLAHRIFEEVGADKRTVLEETGKTLLLRRASLKEQERLRVLKGNLKKQGYLQQIKSLISELTQYDIDKEKMNQMLESAKGKPQLYYKLQDIDILYESFQKELQGKYITAEETLDALCQVAEESKILKNSVIALDGFTGFTPIQQKLMKKLLELAKEVFVTVTIDPTCGYNRIYGEHELFYLSKKTIRSLSEMARECGCEVKTPILTGEKGCQRFQEGGELAFLEQHLFRGGKGQRFNGEKRGQISLHAAANPMEEAHFAARTIRSLISKGMRYQEIAVIVGDLPSYQNYIPRVFAQYAVPCFMDNTRSLLDNPFVEFLRSALNLAVQDYSRENVFRMLRTGLCGLGMEEIDLLENYVLAMGIQGFSRWKRPFEKNPVSWEESQVLLCEEARSRLMEVLQPFTAAVRSAKTTAREKTTALYELICSFEIQAQLARYEEEFQLEGRMELQKEYAQIYGIIMQLFDKMVELLGDETLSAEEYAQILEAGILEEKVGIIPPTADQVQVGDLTRTRLKDIKVMIFLGLNDGWVPSASKTGGLLSDMEREMLQDSGAELAPTARQESYIQKFYLYLNLTKPSSRLYLSCCKASMDGAVMRPSFVMRSVTRLFPYLELQNEDGEDFQIKKAVTPQNGLDVLVEGLQKIREGETQPKWNALLGWYRSQEEYREQAEKLVEAAFLTFEKKGIGRLAARELYGEVLVNSVSRLEKFASCAFAHFLQYGLQLKERSEYVFQAVDMGNIVHDVLERMSARMEKEEKDWATVTDEERDQMVDEAVEQVAAEYGQEILHSSARNEYMIQRMKRILRRTAWALQKQIQTGHFYPVGYEVAFSQAENLKAVNIALSENEKMRLMGRIDRIDVCEKDDQVYVKVIDYKSGSKHFDLVALYYGLQLQLVVYMDAALEMERRIHPDKEVVPAALLYYNVKDPMVDVDAEEAVRNVNQQILRELRPNGLVNENLDVIRTLDAEFEKTSFSIPVTMNSNGTVSKISKVTSQKQMENLNAFVHKKIREIGQRILNGEIAPIPFERKQQTGCDYCAYRSVCGFDSKIPGAVRKRLQEEKADVIWEKIQKDLEE